MHVLQKFKNLMKKQNKKRNKTKKPERLHARKRMPGASFPKIVKYKSPCGSKLNN